MKELLQYKKMFDKYCKTSECVLRLYNTYKERGYLIIAFDFDDTILSSEYTTTCYLPAKLLQECKKYINCKLILYTCRASNVNNGENLYKAIRICEKMGLVPDAVNSNILEEFKVLNGKVYYDLFLDDKAGLGQACDILEELLNMLENERKG